MTHKDLAIVFYKEHYGEPQSVRRTGFTQNGAEVFEIDGKLIAVSQDGKKVYDVREI